MTDIINAREDSNVTPQPPNHDPLASIISKGLEMARKPAGWGSIVITLTLSGYAAIAMSHSDIAAMSIFLLGFSSMMVTIVALCKGRL
jgi:hypothetical protein